MFLLGVEMNLGNAHKTRFWYLFFRATRNIELWTFGYAQNLKSFFFLRVFGFKSDPSVFTSTFCFISFSLLIQRKTNYLCNINNFFKVVENFAPFTRVSRSTKATLRQSVESIVFNHLAHLYSLVTAVVQELLSQTWKRTLDFILVYIRYDWLLLGDNQKKVNQFLQLKCSLSHKI